MHLTHLKVVFHISISAHGKEPYTSGCQSSLINTILSSVRKLWRLSKALPCEED